MARNTIQINETTLDEVYNYFEQNCVGTCFENTEKLLVSLQNILNEYPYEPLVDLCNDVVEFNNVELRKELIKALENWSNGWTTGYPTNIKSYLEKIDAGERMIDYADQCEKHIISQIEKMKKIKLEFKNKTELNMNSDVALMVAECLKKHDERLQTELKGYVQDTNTRSINNQLYFFVQSAGHYIFSALSNSIERVLCPEFDNILKEYEINTYHYFKDFDARVQENHQTIREEIGKKQLKKKRKNIFKR